MAAIKDMYIATSGALVINPDKMAADKNFSASILQKERNVIKNYKKF